MSIISIVTMILLQKLITLSEVGHPLCEGCSETESFLILTYKIGCDVCMEKKTAILIDGAFYRYRSYHFWGELSPHERADELERYCKRHIGKYYEKRELYRIFYYDCSPSSKSIYHPLLKKSVDLSKTPLYQWTEEFFEELKKRRKFALRLGILSDENANYALTPHSVRKLCDKKISVEDLREQDFKITNLEQKCVDMKIGIDIATLAYKKQVDQIILIAGDCDFVPASKCARREGIDFILDPMRSSIKPALFEHIDGIRTCCPPIIVSKV